MSLPERINNIFKSNQTVRYITLAAGVTLTSAGLLGIVKSYQVIQEKEYAEAGFYIPMTCAALVKGVSDLLEYRQLER